MSTQPMRLPTSGRIDRSKPLSFHFDGRHCHAYAGDSIASALLANDIRIVARSLKFHRPRGIMSAGAEETHALLSVRGAYGEVPLVRATLQPVRDGDCVNARGGFPSRTFDIGRLLDLTHRLWVAGFYHKTFMWPGWKYFEKPIRRLAGLGRLPMDADGHRYFPRNEHCDVLVVGSGPAGLAAALGAANTNARVLLVEQDFELGGSLLSRPATLEDKDGSTWLQQTQRTLGSLPNVKILTGCAATGYYDHNVLSLSDHSTPGVERFWLVRAGHVVLATGAIEQPLVFSCNDRPGIMLAAAAATYVYRFAVKPAQTMAVVTNNDSAYHAAFTLHDAGVVVPVIADVRGEVDKSLLSAAARRCIPVEVRTGVRNTQGIKQLSAIDLCALSSDGRAFEGASKRVGCDGLAMSGGFNPTVHLYAQAGGKLAHDTQLACLRPLACRQAVTAVGAANGTFELEHALREGREAGIHAATQAPGEPLKKNHKASISTSTHLGAVASRIAPAERRERQWIDFLHDVTAADIELAVRENFVSVEHCKRYTTTGMSADQGKTSNLSALSLLGELTERTPSDVGTTTFRPHFSPVPMGAIAAMRQGDLYRPSHLLHAHAWHREQGAHFGDYGPWRRPEFYHRAGLDGQAAIRDEVLAVRRGAGLVDNSPIGKIDVRGPDAGEFLNRLLVSDLQSLQPGQVRYSAMLDENGIAFDDAIVAKLADHHYLLNTPSPNLERVVTWMERWHQCEWSKLRLVISPVTAASAQFTITGPNARAVLEQTQSTFDFSASALPSMNIVAGTFLGLPARAMRVSYTGELSFEISMPTRASERVIRHLMQVGGGELRPIGLEAVEVLRIEKGILFMGADANSGVNALDLGYAAEIGRKAGDFLGRRSLLRSDDRRADRRQLVGVLTREPAAPIPAGAHFVAPSDDGYRSQGFITHCCFSPTLRRHIGLGFLERGFQRGGETVKLYDEGTFIDATVAAPSFYDPTGERLHA